MQERALGGLTPATRRFLRQCSNDADSGRPARFCSALLASGTPPTEVQKYSGHARLSTLLDIYAHFIRSEQADAIEQYAAKVFG